MEFPIRSNKLKMTIFQFMFVIQTKKILENQNVDCFAFKQLKSIINDIIFHLQRKNHHI